VAGLMPGRSSLEGRPGYACRQRFVDAPDISSPNDGDVTGLAGASRPGKEPNISNQGRSWYRFAFYKIAGQCKGGRAR
jgi:hypothetical protein